MMPANDGQQSVGVQFSIMAHGEPSWNGAWLASNDAAAAARHPDEVAERGDAMMAPPRAPIRPGTNMLITRCQPGISLGG